MINFQEVTNSAGISNLGLSYSGSWGDFNGDQYPDLWVGNHHPWKVQDSFNYFGKLYLNQQDGTFADITLGTFFPFSSLGDRHGASWADFDNDGDSDFIVLVGAIMGTAADPNQFFVNEGGQLTDQAAQFGVDYPLSRGRTPLWLDFDQDGNLDLFLGAEKRPDGLAPPAIFRQTENGFEDFSSTLGFDLDTAEYGLLSDLSGDGKLDLVIKSDPLTIYDINSNSFTDITNNLTSSAIYARDIASGDFNGDLRPDLYLTRSTRFFTSDLVQDDANTAKVRIANEAGHQGVHFDSSGDVTFVLNIGSIPSLYPPIYLGASGSILNIDRPQDLTFTLSANSPEVQGILPHNPGVDRGIYLGYDSNLEQWQILVSSPDRINLFTLIETSEPLSDLTAINFDPNILPGNDQLLINTGNGLIDQSQASGINSLDIAGTSVATGDFDNDMDLDLYFVATGSAGNRPNILYENQGDGTFVAVPNAGGAQGTNLGVGDSVVVADYDLDGFLDLFVTNGDGQPNFSVEAPSQLFRNQGNENHWLEIDLEGVVSNRDGIGAQVFVTAGGVTQLREQSGGIHNKSQDHQRLHFGLADNTTVDEILIRWPNGYEQRMYNLAVDQLLNVIEPAESSPPEPPESFAPGQPNYNVGEESGVFLWKDTFDGPYHLRTVGAQDRTEFQIDLIANDGLLDTNPLLIEADDNFEANDFGFSFYSRLLNGQDGVDFHLPPKAQALFAITQDGVTNPNQLSVGSERTSLSLDGWVINSDEFPLRPDFTPGEDLGLFVGQDSNNEQLEFRWNGDGNYHRSDLSVLSDEDTTVFSPVNLEMGTLGDEITNFNNGVTIESYVSTEWDGLDVTTTEPTKIGFAYEQDGLFSANHVNPGDPDDLLNSPNAYWLPLATPYGKPAYNASEESGLFLWKEEEGSWHLRVTAGADINRSYIGSIVSDSPATSVEGISIEGNDLIDTSDPMRIDFALYTFQGYEDGIDFSFPTDASLTINLKGDSQEAASLFQIGSERWSVSEVPLDISGW